MTSTHNEDTDKPKPTMLRALWDTFTLRPFRDEFLGGEIVVCPECGQRWDSSYAIRYFEYCYTCGVEVEHEE